MPPDEYNPGPAFFREAAEAAAEGRTVGYYVKPETRYWCERSLGLKPTQGLFGFGEYAAPNHGRVICFLWLELLAGEQAGERKGLPSLSDLVFPPTIRQLLHNCRPP